MRILIVADAYRPEVSSAAKLMQELAEALAARGHGVTVLTTAPTHKLDPNDAAKRWPEFALEGPVTVVRARMLALHHTDYVRRGLAVLLAPFQMWRALRRHVGGDFDAVFIYSPPITLGFIGAITRRRGAGVLLNVQDLFPQNAIDLGILRNPALIALFRWIERFSYRHADVVTAHSKSNLDRLAAAHRDLAGKFRILHNWIDVADAPPARKIDFCRAFGLEGKFVALFGGVLGPSQNVQMLVEVADRLRDLDDLVLLIVGDGSEKRRVEDLARARGLRNVLFKPLIAPEDYQDLLAVVDVGLVCLGTAVKTPVVPGKILAYMAASLPVAAFVNAESDVHPLIAEAGCGASCVSDDLTAMERILRRLHDNPQERKRMGSAGRKYAIEHFSKDRIADRIERMMEQMRPCAELKGGVRAL
jgi:glycosyltransferase involved in cell wall biosynthesis